MFMGYFRFLDILHKKSNLRVFKAIAIKPLGGSYHASKNNS